MKHELELPALSLDEILDLSVGLEKYCSNEDYKGWDPYDGLNSKVFKAIPLIGRSAVIRLVWIQIFKRSPINLRKLFLVPKQHNAKGIALFLQGYVNILRVAENNPQVSSMFGGTGDLTRKIVRLADMLLEMRSAGYSGSAWGYNFPWQCRREFLFPAYEPTVVATCFCATALFEAYEVTGDERYRQAALESAHFVTEDLHRTPHKGGFIFSYSRLPGNDTIYNASLLGSKLLSYCYKYTGEESYRRAAMESVIACCADQRADGSWTYGVKPVTGWIDSFHTGYNLDGLVAYQELTGDTGFSDNIKKGFDFYIRNFFSSDGTPDYYHDSRYPIDIHCPAQLFVTLSRLHMYREYECLADKVLSWTICHMRSDKGYFYYQIKPGVSSKIPYMRWSNAFMFAALTYVIMEKICGH